MLLREVVALWQSAVKCRSRKRRQGWVLRSRKRGGRCTKTPDPGSIASELLHPYRGEAKTEMMATVVPTTGGAEMKRNEIAMRKSLLAMEHHAKPLKEPALMLFALATAAGFVPYTG